MSNSQAEPNWLDEGLPLPKAGLIWPWIATATVLFSLGVWLLLPSLQENQAKIQSDGPTLVASASPTLTAPTSQGTLNMLFVDSPASSFATAAQGLDRLIRQGSQGKLSLSLHPSGLYAGKKLDELAIIEAVRSGKAQLGAVTCSPLANFSSDFEVFDLPFLFRDYEHADRVLMGPIGEKLLARLEQKGLVGLGTLEVGFRIFSSSVPLPTLAEFRGKRVRVMQSATSIRMARQLGCEAVPSPVDKIYQMGKEGYIDAADRTYPTYWDFNLYEVQRYITDTRHSYTMKVIVMNKEAFDQLSEAERQSVRQAVRDIEKGQREAQRAEDRRVKEECRKRGIQIYELTPQEMGQFVEACRPLYEEYRKLRGSSLLDKVIDS
jgi:tripartite ATP-independent transporter DctP family solute receptor